jgi:hypothetical protein
MGINVGYNTFFDVFFDKNQIIYYFLVNNRAWTSSSR